jgi:hypothetical protein
MSSKAEMAEADAWCGLIAEARHALAMLRAEDLEALAIRAQTMIEAAGGHGPEFREKERTKVVRQHRLLGDLLHATRQNLEVLRRLRGGTSGHRDTGEVNRRWGR